jgi:hypothetical protein
MSIWHWSWNARSIVSLIRQKGKFYILDICRILCAILVIRKWLHLLRVFTRNAKFLSILNGNYLHGQRESKIKYLFFSIHKSR